MASVTIMKHTSVATKAQGRHNYRENKNNSNKHIDPTKSHLNKNLDTRYSNSTEMQTAILKRVKEVDAVLPPQRKKKDRIVSVCIEIPAPRENMSYEDAVRFLEAADKAITKKLGEENCHGSMIHADEQHKYIDTSKDRFVESRIHLHKDVIPYVDGKGVNGKEFVKKQLYRELNQLLDEVCMKELGYKFQDGSKQKSRGKVEELKYDSIKANHALNKKMKNKNQELTQENESLQTKNNELKEQAKEIEEFLDYGTKKCDELQNKIFDSESKLKELRDLNDLCERVANQQPKEYKKNLTGKFIQVPVEDLDEIQKIPMYAKTTSEYLEEALKTLKEARREATQAYSDLKQTKKLEETYKGYNEKLANLNEHIDREATKKAKKMVYEQLGSRVDEDRQLSAFFNQEKLWLKFQNFCQEFALNKPKRTKEKDYGMDR